MRPGQYVRRVEKFLLKPCLHPLRGSLALKRPLRWGMWTPKQDKTLGQSDAKAPMEAVEFLVALFTVVTLPNERGGKQSSDLSQDEIRYKQSLNAHAVKMGSHFKIGVMCLGKDFLLK